jgi:SNF2 family DNA or RNA helicase
VELYDYQKEAANKAYVLDKHILLCDCGTGKTAIELAVINHRIAQSKIKRVLVIAPLSILWTAWADDIQKFYPNLEYEIFWHKDMDKRLDLIDNFNKDIAIMNYEVVKKCSNSLIDKYFDMIVLDESTRIKNRNSSTTKLIFNVARNIQYRTLMTATPGWIPDHYYSPLVFIGSVAPDSFTQFKNYFCTFYRLGDTGMKVYVPKAEKSKDLKRLLHKQAIRLKKEDCLDLPEKIFSVREVFLNQQARSVYDKMLNDNVVVIENEVVMAEFPIILRNKLRQIADGVLYSGDKRFRIHKEKIKELDYLIDANHKQIIIWANYTEDVKTIAKRYEALTLFSETPDKTKAINDFKNGKNRIIVCHPASAGHGITWTNCNIHIYYNLPDSLELFLQSQDRSHRIGQTNKCTYYLLVAKKTVDEIVWANLKIRQNFQNNLLDYIKQHLKKETL